MFDSPLGSWRPQCPETLREKSLQKIVVMQSLFTSQGESRPWLVQMLARRGRRYALATRGLSERTSREEWGWWGSSQWDRYNSKEIETCLLLLRTYLASGLCDEYIRIVRNIQKRIKIKRPYRETLGRYPSKFKSDSTLLQNSNAEWSSVRWHSFSYRGNMTRF